MVELGVAEVKFACVVEASPLVPRKTESVISKYSCVRDQKAEDTSAASADILLVPIGLVKSNLVVNFFEGNFHLLLLLSKNDFSEDVGVFHNLDVWLLLFSLFHEVKILRLLLIHPRHKRSP